MSNQDFAGNTAIRYCIRAAHCCLDNIYKLGYIVVSWFYIICSWGVTNQPKNKGVIEASDRVESIGDGGVLE
jgi:hypothetical protein